MSFPEDHKILENFVNTEKENDNLELIYTVTD